MEYHGYTVFFGMCGRKHRARSDSEMLSLLLSLATEKEERDKNTQTKTLPVGRVGSVQLSDTLVMYPAKNFNVHGPCRTTTISWLVSIITLRGSVAFRGGTNSASRNSLFEGSPITAWEEIWNCCLPSHENTMIEEGKVTTISFFVLLIAFGLSGDGKEKELR